MKIKKIGLLTLSTCALLFSCNKNPGLNRHPFKDCDQETFISAIDNIQSSQINKKDKYTLFEKGSLSLINKVNTNINYGNKNYKYYLDLNNKYNWSFDTGYYKKSTVYKENETNNEDKNINLDTYFVINEKTVENSYYELRKDNNKTEGKQHSYDEYSMDEAYINNVAIKDMDKEIIVSGLIQNTFDGMISGSSKTTSKHFIDLATRIDLPVLVNNYKKIYENTNYTVDLKYGSNNTSSAMMSLYGNFDPYLFDNVFNGCFSAEGTNLKGSAKVNVYISFENNFISQIETTIKGEFTYKVDKEDVKASYDTYFSVDTVKDQCTTDSINLEDWGIK